MKNKMNMYQQFIFKSRYARFLPEKNRREHWNETVQRYVEFMANASKTGCGYELTTEEKQELYDSIYNLEVMPSMRAMMTAGKAAERDNTCCFNCAYLAVDDPKAFDEAMHILMCGTGVGFSVERQEINKLPDVPDKLFDSETVIKVKDSKEGWAKAFRVLISLLYAGEVPKWDLSAIRPAGSRLKTFGGRASGPDPLNDLFEFTVRMFRGAAGRKLNSLECHDLMCKIGEIVVVGGVRRCLPSGSMVHTQDGMTAIEDIQVGDMVLTSNGYRKVSNKFDQGKQRLVKVKTQDSDFLCTPNHRIAVLNGIDSYEWKMASDLDVGDRLVAPSFGSIGESVCLPEFIYSKPKHSTTCKDIAIPEFDNDMAWFLGYFHGNGYVRLTGKSGEVSISCPKDLPSVIERVKQQLSRFSVHCGLVDYENYVVIRTKSKQLASYFHAWLKQPKSTIRVPDFLWSASIDNRMSYIGGLMDADGSGKVRPVQVCTTVYKEYSREVYLLLSSCGVQSRIKNVSEVSLQEGWQKKYSVSVINNKSKDALRPFTAKDVSTSSAEQLTNSYPKEFLSFAYPNNYPWSKTDGKLIPSAVVSVTDVDGEYDTWDIEVEDMHEFFCEGYLMHNSALISLSNLSDDRMRHAKAGAWWEKNPQRALANNSAAYTEKPEVVSFMDEWKSLYESKSGERGIINRKALKKHILKNGRRSDKHDFGVNPCSEIILRSGQMCNLSEVVIRSDDTVDSLKRKIRVASIIGTIQSSLTTFPYLRKLWKNNCDEERLLGVSLTGIFDSKLMSDKSDGSLPGRLEELREHAVAVNKEWAEKLKIPQSTAVTCVKPSGTVSQLCDCASGIHPRHSKYYFRRVRGDVKDPLTQYMIMNGIPNEPCVSKKDTTVVFTFPIESPEGSYRDKIGATDHLDLWLLYQRHWCEHKPSVTISLKEDEWFDVAAWVWKNFDEMTGVSFLPYDGGTYKQAPYEECSRSQYNDLLSKIPNDIDWSLLVEEDDNVEGTQTLACSGGSCEI